MKNIWPEIVIAFFTALLSWIVNRATIVAELKKQKGRKLMKNSFLSILNAMNS